MNCPSMGMPLPYCCSACWPSPPLCVKAASLSWSPSTRHAVDEKPPIRRRALCTMASSTGCTSSGESAMTARISAVAVWRSSASFVSLNSRAFSIAIRAWSRNASARAISLIAVGARPFAPESEHADALAPTQQREHQRGTDAELRVGHHARARAARSSPSRRRAGWSCQRWRARAGWPPGPQPTPAVAHRPTAHPQSRGPQAYASPHRSVSLKPCPRPAGSRRR